MRGRHTQLWGAHTHCSLYRDQVIDRYSKSFQTTKHVPYSLWLPFETILLICRSQHRSDYTVRPRSLVLLTTSSFLLAMYRSGGVEAASSNRSASHHVTFGWVELEMDTVYPSIKVSYIKINLRWSVGLTDFCKA